MTTQQKNIAIAEVCGWTLEQSNSYDGKCWHFNGIQSEIAPPDFTSDLNAMHDAENTVNINWTKYLYNLYNLACPGGGITKDRIVCQATAQQRADAFLKTIGKL